MLESPATCNVKVTFPKPPLRPRPEAVCKFQQAAAREELAGIGDVDVDRDGWFGQVAQGVTSWGSVRGSKAEGSALAAQSAARSSDSRYASPQRPYRR